MIYDFRIALKMSLTNARSFVGCVCARRQATPHIDRLNLKAIWNQNAICAYFPRFGESWSATAWNGRAGHPQPFRKVGMNQSLHP